jgi:hypothetical protein
MFLARRGNREKHIFETKQAALAFTRQHERDNNPWTIQAIGDVNEVENRPSVAVLDEFRDACKR